MSIRVTVWNENVHDKHMPELIRHYPQGIHGALASFLSKETDFEVTIATLDMPEQGLPDSVLDNTDVLLWWGHCAHWQVDDALVGRIVKRVMNGMGFVPLHSSHASKAFTRLMGTYGDLSWGDTQQEILWTVLPGHAIANGIPDHIMLDEEEMYGEPFDIPQPDELVFIGWYKHGNIFRSGCCYNRGRGKIFYFQPGHETCPSYNNPIIQRIIVNAVRWAAPNTFPAPIPGCYNIPKLVD